MRFPRGCPSELVSVNDRRLPMFSSLDMPCITKFSERELSLLEKLVTISSDVKTEKVLALPVDTLIVFFHCQICIMPDMVSYLK